MFDLPFNHAMLQEAFMRSGSLFNNVHTVKPICFFPQIFLWSADHCDLQRWMMDCNCTGLPKKTVWFRADRSTPISMDWRTLGFHAHAYSIYNVHIKDARYRVKHAIVASKHDPFSTNMYAWLGTGSRTFVAVRGYTCRCTFCHKSPNSTRDIHLLGSHSFAAMIVF